MAPETSAARRDTASAADMFTAAAPAAAGGGGPQTASPRRAPRDSGATRKLEAATNAIGTVEGGVEGGAIGVSGARVARHEGAGKKTGVWGMCGARIVTPGVQTCQPGDGLWKGGVHGTAIPVGMGRGRGDEILSSARNSKTNYIIYHAPSCSPSTRSYSVPRFFIGFGRRARAGKCRRPHGERKQLGWERPRRGLAGWVLWATPVDRSSSFARRAGAAGVPP